MLTSGCLTGAAMSRLKCAGLCFCMVERVRPHIRDDLKEAQAAVRAVRCGAGLVRGVDVGPRETTYSMPCAVRIARANPNPTLSSLLLRAEGTTPVYHRETLSSLTTTDQSADTSQPTSHKREAVHFDSWTLLRGRGLLSLTYSQSAQHFLRLLPLLRKTPHISQCRLHHHFSTL